MPAELTFDDGPGPSTPALLRVLRQAGCTATFFVLGCHLVGARVLGARIVAEGHTLGNHTWSHARPRALTDAALRVELHATDALIRQAYHDAGCGAPSRIPVRLPYGVVDDDPRLATLAALGRRHTGWTALLPDWQRPAPCASTLVTLMQNHLADGAVTGQPAVFCLHDGSRYAEARPATVAAVWAFLRAVRRDA